MRSIGAIRPHLVAWALALVVIILPFSIKGTSIAINLVGLAWIVEGDWKKKFSRLRSNYLFFIFISLFLIQAIGLFHTENMSKGNSELIKKLSLFVFPLILASSPNITLPRITMVFKAYVLSCLTAVIICLGYATFQAMNYKADTKSINWDLITIDEFKASNAGYSHRWDAFSYMEFSSILEIHPTYLSLFILFALLIIFYLKAYHPLKRFAKIISFGIIMIFFGALILLAARIILLISVFLVLLFIVKYFIERKQIGRIFLYSFVFMGLFGLLIYNIPFTKYRLIDQLHFSNFQFPDHHDKWNSTNLRVAQWYCSYQTFLEHPLFGVGTGDFQDHLQACYQTLDLGPFYKVYNSHNQYLQIACSTGILGLLVFLTCLVSPLRSKIPNLYLQFLLVFAISCLTESILQNQKGIVFYSLFNSLLAFGLVPQTVSQKKALLLSGEPL